MTHMPIETDLPTKADLAALSDRNDSRFDRLEAHMVRFDDKLDGFHEALRDQSRTYMMTMTGVMASFAAVIIATGILT